MYWAAKDRTPHKILISYKGENVFPMEKSGGHFLNQVPIIHDQ